MHATGYKSRPELRHLQRALLRGSLPDRRDRRQDDEVEHPGLRRRVPDPRGPAGDQRVRAGRAQRQSEGRGARDLGRTRGTTPARSARPRNTLISQGADVVTHHTDSTAVVQAAEEKGKYAFGYHSDMSKYGPKAHLTATTHQWGDFYTKSVQRRDRRARGSRRPRLGRHEGRHDQARAAQRGDPGRRQGRRSRSSRARSRRARCIRSPGRSRTRTARTRVPAGKTMSDDELGKMDYYVEGVGRKLPKK